MSAEEPTACLSMEEVMEEAKKIDSDKDVHYA